MDRATPRRLCVDSDFVIGALLRWDSVARALPYAERQLRVALFVARHCSELGDRRWTDAGLREALCPWIGEA